MARLCPDSLSIREHREFREWVSFGWDKNSRKSVDAATFFSYEPFGDPALDRIADENRLWPVMEQKLTLSFPVNSYPWFRHLEI